MKISVWLFDDAPQKYQEMSRHGSDEDLVIVFHDIIDPFAAQAETPSPFYQLLPDCVHWYAPEPERDYATSWGFIQRVHDGDDLIAITAHA